MPDLLPRFIQVLRIVNYGPTLAEFIRHNIVAQLPITSDILQFNTRGSQSEWQHFAELDRTVRADRVPVAGGAESAASDILGTAGGRSSTAGNSTADGSRQRFADQATGWTFVCHVACTYFSLQATSVMFAYLELFACVVSCLSCYYF